MAIIKCPECGHQVSDHAKTCPNCGIEIEGNIKNARSVERLCSRKLTAVRLAIISLPATPWPRPAVRLMVRRWCRWWRSMSLTAVKTPAGRVVPMDGADG